VNAVLRVRSKFHCILLQSNERGREGLVRWERACEKEMVEEVFPDSRWFAIRFGHSKATSPPYRRSDVSIM